jgi:osmotically inducible protein OsmC
MPVRTAEARWEGTLQDGKGEMRFGGGAFEGPYSFSSRFEEGAGTNPEELIAAAHAGCFSMAFAKQLAEAGHPPTSVQTTADVHLDKGDEGFAISRVVLHTTGDVPGIEEGEFEQLAEAAKDGCPVSKLLAGAEISVEARLA